ncbi:hypothetical protein HRbin06_00874 [archaeon HR06]|nr:hypothetical protein HRbin06_00874 [archaeon HR06]
MRGSFRNMNKNNRDLEKLIFGPESEEASEYASSIVLTDANILLMPVRSLYGIFAYVTTNFLLNKAKLHFSLLNKDKIIDEIIKLSKGKNLASDDLVVNPKDKCTVNLLENEIKVEINKEIQKMFEKILPKNKLPIDIDNEILKRIVILSDEYSDIIKRATILTTRIKVKYETKTVETGALWTEEYLPELTIMHNLILATKPRKTNGEINDAEGVIKKLTGGLGGSEDEFNIILGGDETIGKGIVKFCKVS